MKKPALLILASLLISMAIAIAAPTPPVLQMRLVLDTPTGDSEPMTYVTHNEYHTYTNTLNIQKTVLLDQTAVKSAKVHVDPLGQPVIEIAFTDAGGKRFAEVTQQNVQKRLAIIVDGQLCEAPFIRDPILSGTAEITGSFSKKEAANLAKKINAARSTD